MVVTTVMVNVKPEYVEDFIAATIINHDQSTAEPGNTRFDILQSDDDPTKFLLYEAYENAQFAICHKETEHYRTWRDTVADFMAGPRTGIKYNSIKP